MNSLRRTHSRTLKTAIAIGLLAGLGATALTVRTYGYAGENKAVQPQTEQLQHALALSSVFRDVTKSVAPSVVNIRTTQKFTENAGLRQNGRRSQPNQGDPMDDPSFRRFFEGQPQPRERVGEGSGVIAREDGYIVTNNHVIDGATEIRVKLEDEREYAGTIVGTDAETDLAVVKIDATDLIAAKFGDSDAMEVGDWVLAMGSPFQLQHTVTAGIVSAKNRMNLGKATFENYIQTDAAINPGNSGGPLVNLYSEVIGINAIISTTSGASAGIGFAIPSNMAKSVFNSIVENGKVERGWLGVRMGPIDKEAAEYTGYHKTQGVLVAQVLPDGPAHDAGLQDGDIITKLNGRAVAAPSDLLNAIAAIRPGEKARFDVFRNGEIKELTVTMGNRADQVASAKRGGSEPQAAPAETDNLGISVETLTPEIAEQLGIAEKEGVVVTEVDQDGPAAAKGVQQGNVITMVNQTKIRNTEDFQKALKNADASKVVRLQVMQGDMVAMVFVKPQDKK